MFKRILFSCLFFIALLGHAQEEVIKGKKSTYLNLSLGFGYSTFRDFATSPLIYRGLSRYIALDRIRTDSSDRESILGAYQLSGRYFTVVGRNVDISNTNVYGGFYSQLYALEKFCTSRWNTKVGGKLEINGNVRNNNALQNNSLGVELFGTLFGSVQVSRDISRKKLEKKKIWFIHYELKPRIRKLSYHLNIGLINNSYRNGFAYIGQSNIVNDAKVFDDYEFRFFSGFRMSSALEYTIRLVNKNAISLAYRWDAYRTGGDLDRFEMSHHVLSVSLLFNTK